MSRMEFYSTKGSQALIDSLYRDLEHRILAAPPGLCPVDAVSAFVKLCHAQTCGKCEVMQSKAKQGKYTASIAAYGYLVGDDELRRPVIDENTAPNVRRMFEMRAKGASSPQIARALNADHVITPSDYTYKRLGKANPYVTTHLWSAGMVRDILKNPVYV